MKLVHWSDCSINNGPAYPSTECDCGAKARSKSLHLRLYHRACIQVSVLKMFLVVRLRNVFRLTGTASNHDIHQTCSCQKSDSSVEVHARYH